MSDNTSLNAGTGGDVVRDIDRGPAKTQVVQLDAGGQYGESLVSPTRPLPVVDQATTSAGNNDNPLAAMLVGDPSGNWAGVNLLEQVIEDGTGVGLNVKVLNQPKLDANGALVVSDALAIPIPYLAIGNAVIIDTTGYQSIQITTAALVATVLSSNDQITWINFPGVVASTAAVSAGLTASNSFVFPCACRFMKITATTAGAAVAYLRSQPYNAGLLGSSPANITQISGVTLPLAGAAVGSGAPLSVSGQDAGGLTRRLLTDTSGRVQSAMIGVDAQGTQRQAFTTGPQGSAQVALMTADQTQFEGQTIVELLGLILQELRVSNQLKFMKSALNDSVPIDDPGVIRADFPLFNQ
jgi:hypothetical protein